ncbi:MAG TPA: hypothetical protein VKD69_25305 [Vicinamibacterales bacterium]|nr:hypothetical protein [Vicinamibacterales bacterium]
MNSHLIAAFCLGAFVAAASAIAAGQPTTPYPGQQTTPYPGQQTTAYPGQMTEARVKVENRGPSEAIPVDLRDINVSEPLRVQVVNGDAAHPTLPPLLVRLPRATWEYATASVPAGQDAVAVLNGRGAQGWEVVGVSIPANGPMTFVLKRMR